MKKIDNLDYFLPFVTVIVACLVSFFALPFDLDSIYDEGYLFYQIRYASAGTIEGLSLWQNILVTVFGQKACSSILTLRTIGYVLKLFTAFLFWLLTQSAVKGGLKKCTYLIVILFMAVPCMGGIVICYNGITQFLLITACATLFRLFADTKPILKVLWAFLIGVLITVSLFSILPSAILIGIAVSVLVLVRYWGDWRNLVMSVLSALFGILIGLFFVHFCVADLNVVVAKMTETAHSISGLNRGYDPLSIFVRILLFLRDMILSLLLITGIYAVCKRMRARFAWPIASLLYIICLLMYGYYQQKPELTTAMLMAVMWYQPLMEIFSTRGIERVSISEYLSNVLKFNNLFVLFLLCFPLLASIGTNIYLGSKMAWFLIPWALSMVLIDREDEFKLFKGEALFVLSLLLLIGQYKEYRSINYSQVKVEDGCLDGIYLTPSQENHFNKVDSLVSLYDFHKDKSVCFATQLSTMTILYIDGITVGNFFQPMDFVAHTNDSLPIPDFLFLTKYDIDIAEETLRSMPWDWPEAFDTHYVGTPETYDTGYSTERWLYCRKINE